MVCLKNKRSFIFNNVFQNILDASNCKSNKIWVDKEIEFYNGSMESWLQDNDREMYQKHNERKSAVAERFIGTLKKLTNIELQY